MKVPGKREYGLKRVVPCVAAALAAVCLSVGAGRAGNDLLRLPAARNTNATAAMLLDVVNTGRRLVAVGERGIVICSDDSGDTWVQSEVPVSVTLTAVCFPTPTHGWAVGHDGVVLHSSDGGGSWEKQLDGDRVNQALLAQVEQLLKNKAADLDRADASSWERFSSAYENLQFFKKDMELAVAEGPTRPFMDVWFMNEREGLVVGAFGMILRTVDGGAVWEPILDRIENPEGLHYYGITRAGDALFIAGELGILYRSDDAGDTWTALDSPYNGTFFGIVGSSGSPAVIAFGLRGNAFRSIDMGTTWSPLDTPKGTSLSGAAVLSDNSVALVGYSGALIQSPDMGETLAVMKTACQGCTAVAESHAGHVVMVGLRGLVRQNLNRFDAKDHGEMT